MRKSEIEAVDLAQSLKLATADMHRRVERSAFMARLLRGQITRVEYITLLYNLHALYAALENALQQQAAHPAVAAVLMPELFRCPAIEADLTVLAAMQPGDEPIAALLPATRDYARRLESLAVTQPQLLVAHAYVRYLGDLNGGQALRRVVARALALSGGAGTAFYDFGAPEVCLQLIRRFRAGLQGVPEPDSHAIVVEAVHAFECHARLFGELAELTGSGP